MSREDDVTRPSSPRGLRRAQLRLERRVGTVGRGVGSARKAHATRASIVVRLHADGHVGLGEASPLPDYSPDSIDDAYACLASIDEEALVAESGSLDALESYLEALELRSPSARFALESAVLDLLAHQQGIPMHRLFGDVGTERPELPLAALVAMESAEAAVATAEARVAEGYAALKAKIGADLDVEIRALAAIRARVGDAIELRLDANGAYGPRDVGERLAALAWLSPSFVEEPCPLHLLDAIPAYAVPVAIDESLPRLERARLERFLASGRVAAVVAKPALLGGFFRTCALARLAASHGVPTIVSHLFDGPIALAGASELALSLAVTEPRARSIAHGLAPHAGLDAHPALASIPYAGRTASRLRFHDDPGLGLDRSPGEAA